MTCGSSEPLTTVGDRCCPCATIAARTQRGPGPVGPADTYVFTAERGGVLRTSSFRAKVWRPAVRAAGLEPLRPHDLRHAAVASWIAAGANPKEVAVRAGHTSVAFTLDRYGHLFEGTTPSYASGWTPCTPKG